MHVGLVDGLKARTACKVPESQEKCEAESPHDDSVSTRWVGMQLGPGLARATGALALDYQAPGYYIGAMFTGLVAAQGTLVTRATRGPGARLTVKAQLEGEPLVLGESIAVDGCCLSVAAVLVDGFEVDASAETLARTTLGRTTPGGAVNLERALRAGDRLGGHLVTGHVDGVGELVDRHAVGEAVAMTFAMPAELERFVAEKGSVAVSGVSLTVNRAAARRFDVTLIPSTLAATNLVLLTTQDQVNLEVDLIARYVARLMDAGDARAIGRTP
jgi:riboflavin synthase